MHFQSWFQNWWMGFSAEPLLKKVELWTLKPPRKMGLIWMKIYFEHLLRCLRAIETKIWRIWSLNRKTGFTKMWGYGRIIREVIWCIYCLLQIVSVVLVWNSCCVPSAGFSVNCMDQVCVYSNKKSMENISIEVIFQKIYPKKWKNK
jgi:hypothetical protein